MTREEEIALRDDISRLKRRVSVLERAAFVSTDPDETPAEVIIDPVQALEDALHWK